MTKGLHNEKRELKYIKSSNYNSKVLTGPWFEDSCSYKKNYYNHTTAYSRDYDLKPTLTTVDPNIKWKFRLKSNESVLSRTGVNDSSYLENFATIYDLSYNHFPKLYKENIPRKLRFRLEIHEPHDDYLNSFGNITNYGILKNKKAQWHCDKQDPRLTYTTNYHDTYIAPDRKCYNYFSRKFDTIIPYKKTRFNPVTWQINKMYSC